MIKSFPVSAGGMTVLRGITAGHVMFQLAFNVT
jgi:hypothetical protein